MKKRRIMVPDSGYAAASHLPWHPGVEKIKKDYLMMADAFMR